MHHYFKGVGVELYETSAREMNRRKTAFQALSISLLVSTSVTSFGLFYSSLQLVIPVIAVLAIALTVSIFFLRKLFENSKSTTVSISNNILERKNRKRGDTYAIECIKKVRIKRNSKDLIREMRLDIYGHNPVYINGISRFEECKDHLQRMLRSDVEISQIKEPIDFDHPLFYPIFGIFVGTMSVFFIQFLCSIQISSFKYFQLAIACFVIIFGMYWCVNKPIVGSYGRNKKRIDYSIGIIFMFIGIGILLLSGILKF